MDYQKIYNDIVLRAKGRNITEYTEIHHIIPRCLNGTNDKENLVKLTAREHYIAHQLLIKINPNEPKLIFAAKAMTIDKNGNRLNNRMYSWLKKKHSKAVSNRLKGKSYEELFGEEKAAIKRANHSAKMKGWTPPPRTKEHSDRIIASKRASGSINQSPEAREKNRQSHLGKTQNQKTKDKISFANTGNIRNDVAKSVICIELDMTFRTCVEAARYVGIKHSSDIGRAAKNPGKTCGGYNWRFSS